MNLQIFATVHSLMNYTISIDSCQAHLPEQRFGSYRGLTGHWKFIHEPTVNLYQCAGCQKTFLKKQSLPVGTRLGVTEGWRVTGSLYMSQRSIYTNKCAGCQKTFLKKQWLPVGRPLGVTEG